MKERIEDSINYVYIKQIAATFEGALGFNTALSGSHFSSLRLCPDYGTHLTPWFFYGTV
jgi:hypothetical protein